MANQEHVDLLRQGTEVWNQWRRTEPRNIMPDLAWADLQGCTLDEALLYSADLRGTNLSHATLRNSVLNGSNLTKANLSYADMSGADLTDVRSFQASFKSANLRAANLCGVDFHAADLTDANLRGASLRNTKFYRSYLKNIDIKGASVQSTFFGDCDLGSVHGLGQVIHHGPSSVDVETLIRSQGAIPLAFLRGVGLSEQAIMAMKPLMSVPLIKQVTCYICYAPYDKELVERLYRDLQERGVRCWFAPYGIIDELRRFSSQHILVLSETAIASGEYRTEEEVWPAGEISKVATVEAEQQRSLLLPIGIDEAIFRSEAVWAQILRHTRSIVDFRHWEDNLAYQRALEQLVEKLTEVQLRLGDRQGPLKEEE